MTSPDDYTGQLLVYLQAWRQYLEQATGAAPRTPVWPTGLGPVPPVPASTTPLPAPPPPPPAPPAPPPPTAVPSAPTPPGAPIPPVATPQVPGAPWAAPQGLTTGPAEPPPTAPADPGTTTRPTIAPGTERGRAPLPDRRGLFDPGLTSLTGPVPDAPKYSAYAWAAIRETRPDTRAPDVARSLYSEPGPGIRAATDSAPRAPQGGAPHEHPATPALSTVAPNPGSMPSPSMVWPWEPVGPRTGSGSFVPAPPFTRWASVSDRGVVGDAGMRTARTEITGADPRA